MLEGWRKQFKDLEKEKELLLNKMKKKKDSMISNLIDEIEEMKKYVRKLERENEDNCYQLLRALVTCQNDNKRGE